MYFYCMVVSFYPSHICIMFFWYLSVIKKNNGGYLDYFIISDDIYLSDFSIYRSAGVQPVTLAL